MKYTTTVLVTGAAVELAERAIYFLADNEQSSLETGRALVVDGSAMTRFSGMSQYVLPL
jgi:hypothetical protein